ncbi:MAG: hypothetical protein AMS15_05365 [Planctomycetes bacterium DG_23]|nr:MAG: hypothetical protein AMS15_05365 [Planctomycetes bacterium DG_23]
MIKSLKARKVTVYMALLIGLHIYLNFILIPPDQLFNENPIYQDDYCGHFYRALIAKKMLWEEGAVWGYDPHFMAGYPVGTVTDADNKSTGLVVWAFSFLGEGRAFKFYVFIIYLALPIFIYLTARNFDLTNPEAAIASTLALFFWYFCDWVDSLPMWGGFSFALMSYLSLYSFSLFYKYLQTGKLGDFVIFSLVSAWTVWTHVFVLFCLILPVGFTYLLSIKERKRKFHLFMFIWVVWIGLTNSPWVLPLWKFLHYKIPTKEFFPSMGLGHIYSKPVANIMLPFAWGGVVLWALEKKHIKAFSLLFVCLFLTVVTAYGSQLPVFHDLEPLRFFLPLAFFASIPAARGIGFVVRFLQQGVLNLAKSMGLLRKLGQWPFKIIFLLLVLLVLSVQMLKIAVWEPGEDCLFRELTAKGEHLEATLPPEAWQIIEWIRKNTSREGRILIEDSSEESGHKYFGTQMPALLPWYTRRQFIGGPVPDVYILHHFAEFTGGVLFKKDLGLYTPSLLRDYFDTYNIRWIIAWSNKAKKSFIEYPYYTTVSETIGDFSLYEVNRRPTFFLKGGGKIKADYNQISVTEASAGEVVLKFHWLSTLKTKPPLKIERYRVLDDPVGFIKVYNGEVRNFVIYNTY